MVICFVGSAELLHGEKRFPPPHRRRVGGIQVKREALEKLERDERKEERPAFCVLVGHLLRQCACQFPPLTKEEQM